MNFCAKLGLGTVQWGMPYGIANKSGRPEADEVGRMLALARESGVNMLDTAYGYGDAELAIGHHQKISVAFEIVTKTRPIRSGNSAIPEFSRVSSAFAESMKRLRCSKVHGLLVHHADDLLANGADQLWESLQELKISGLVSKIGVSVYTPEQLDLILKNFPIDLVQLPFNLYDQRFLRTGLLERLGACGVEVHARSAFLQGLLLIPPNQLPGRFEALRKRHASLYECFVETGVTPLEGCLRFCLGQSQIDRVIIGCETSDQLEGILTVAKGHGVCLENPDQFTLEDESVINPARWPQ